MIDYAIQKAREMPYEQGKPRVYAVIVDKKGTVLSEGSNSFTKTHPTQAYFAEKVDLPLKVFLHAEISALVKVRKGTPHKIYVARVDFEGTPMYAAPCPICAEAIAQSTIQSVEYTS